MSLRTLRIAPLWMAIAAVAAVLALYAPTFASMVAIWNRDSTFTHGYLIPLLSAWLLWRDREALAAQPIAPGYRAAWLIVALALLWFAANLVEVQVVRQAAATAMIPAALWMTLGTRWMRRALFPLAYLLFAVPFGDFLVPSLVQFTTEFTVNAVRFVGVPIYRDGASFSLPSGNFEVVKACSGVRYLIATIALGTLFAALSYSTWRRRLAFMALCLVLPVIANGFRAFGIVMIAHYSEMKYAVGLDHLLYGWIFFGFVMLFLFWIGGKFADANEAQATTNESNVSDAAAPYVPALYALTALVLLLAIAPATTLLIHRHGAGLAATNVGAQLREGDSTWRGPRDIGDRWQPAFAAAGSSASGRYSSDSNDVHVFVRRYAWQEEGANEATAAPLVTPEQLSWRFDAQGQQSVGERIADVSEVVGRNGERWRVWRWYLVGEQIASGASHAKLLELQSWLRGIAPQATIVCIAVSMRDARSSDASAADAVLARFAGAFDWRLMGR